MKRDTKHRLGPFRDPDIEAQVLSATRRLLVERGYRRTSIDAIAEESGISKPTIYRRWPSKAHVVYDAVYPDNAPDVEPSARPFTEIDGAIHGIVQMMGDAAAREALPGLTADMRTDPTLQPKFAGLHNARVTRGLRELLARNPGTLRPVDADVLLDTIAGAAMQALCVRGIDDVEGFADALADLLLNGLRARSSE